MRFPDVFISFKTPSENKWMRSAYDPIDDLIKSHRIMMMMMAKFSFMGYAVIEERRKWKNPSF